MVVASKRIVVETSKEEGRRIVLSRETRENARTGVTDKTRCERQHVRTPQVEYACNHSIGRDVP